MHTMPTCLAQVKVGSVRPFTTSSLHGSRPPKSSFALVGWSIRCRAADSSSSRGRAKSGKQQRRDASDAAKRGVDDAADSLKGGIRSAEGAINDAADNAGDAADSAANALNNLTTDSSNISRPNALEDPRDDALIDARADARKTTEINVTAGGAAESAANALNNMDTKSSNLSRPNALEDPRDDVLIDARADARKTAEISAADTPRTAASGAGSARGSVDNAAASLKGAVRNAEDAAGSQRESVAGAADAATDAVDSAADAAKDAGRAAERYAANPEAAVGDAADAVTEGIDAAAQGFEEGIDQAREYAEDPKLAVSDTAAAAEEGVDSLADNLKAGVRAVRQGVTDSADATKEAAEDAQTQGQPRIGARPVTVSYSSGAGATQTDTSTSSGPGAASAGVDAAGAAREAGAQVDDLADDLERNIDAAAQQAEGIIEAAGERLEGAIDDAPRQASAVLQQVVDSTADAIKSTQSTADDVREDFDKLQAPGPAAPFASTPLTSLPSVAPEKDDVSFMKKRLLYSVAGLDRGLAANAGAELAVETAIYSLVGAAGGSPPLTWTPKEGDDGDESTLGMLGGTWRLVYSSGFASGSLGGLRPGPQAALLPITIGQVYQVISTATATLDNVVEFYTRYQLPSLPGLPPTEPIVTTLRLRHSLEILPASSIQITFEDTQVNVTGGLGGVLGKLPELTVPQLPEPLKPSRQMRSSTFEVLFLDSDLRITRGDRGELRVFVRT